MTETGRPYGGTNQRDEDEGLPGERAQEETVGADPAQSPRAAQGDMSDDVTRVPAGGDHLDAKKPGMPDATGPQG